MRRKEQRDPTLMSKLIMVVAFDPDEHGNLQPILSPTEPRSEACAIRTAVALSARYRDVVAWSRQADATEHTVFQEWCSGLSNLPAPRTGDM
jgi:hypothetical protein